MSTPDTHDDLHEHFASVVGDARIDLDVLTTGARRRGGRIRLRRRVTAVAGAAAVGAVVVAGASLSVGPGTSGAPPVTDQDTVTDTAVPDTTPLPDGTPLRVPEGEGVPITGRSTAAALLDLVGQRSAGHATDVAGQGQPPQRMKRAGQPETFARFTWTPSSGGAGTPVMVNVQPGFDEIDDTVSGRPFFSCRDGRLRCSVVREHGMVVVSYEERNHGGIDRHVDVLHESNGYRVSVASTNTSDFEKAAPVRRGPPLSTAVLREIATAPVWGATLPRPWAVEGEHLASYDDLDANVW